MPRITIGVPVYNSAALIHECLTNLERQTFTDFEVIVSDNASEDDTVRICEKFAERDKRFRVVQHDSTSSAMENFIFVLSMADSPFFLWRAYDDLSSENYLEALSAVHDEHPGIALAAPQIIQDFGGAKTNKVLPYFDVQNGSKGYQILRRMRHMRAAWFYGLWRTDAAVVATEGILPDFQNGWAADYLAIFHAAVNGGIRGSNSAQFSQRLIKDVRDYMPRPKPTFREMTDRNRRFRSAALSIIENADLSGSDQLMLRAYMPLFVNRCSHRMKRVLQGAARDWRNR